jgi:hypothetical protein
MSLQKSYFSHDIWRNERGTYIQPVIKQYAIMGSVVAAESTSVYRYVREKSDLRGFPEAETLSLSFIEEPWRVGDAMSYPSLRSSEIGNASERCGRRRQRRRVEPEIFLPRAKTSPDQS